MSTVHSEQINNNCMLPLLLGKVTLLRCVLCSHTEIKNIIITLANEIITTAYLVSELIIGANDSHNVVHLSQCSVAQMPN